MRHSRTLAYAAVLAIASGSSSCSPSGFASEDLVSTVRIFASSADKPYAQPGESVTYEGRRLTVVEMEARRISKIRVEPVEEEAGEPGAKEQPPTG